MSEVAVGYWLSRRVWTSEGRVAVTWTTWRELRWVSGEGVSGGWGPLPLAPRASLRAPITGAKLSSSPKMSASSSTTLGGMGGESGGY